MPEPAVQIRSSPVIAGLVCVTQVAGQTARESAEMARVANTSFAGLSALQAADAVPDAVVLYPSDAAQASEWLINLRRDTRFALTPIFLSQRHGDFAAALADGIVESSERLQERVNEIKVRRALLAPRDQFAAEDLLLAYLYTRNGARITPVSDWHARYVYRYPLLDVFATKGTDGFEWSSSLRRRGLIEPVELVDRLHQCASCGSAHLNYIDVCPECGDIDISEEIFLHCYACGHVAKQGQFADAGALTCPKCTAKLRHIGVDYDRALETLSCIKCDARFTEAAVEARCLECHTKHDTQELHERRVHAYRLSSAGETAARTGDVGELLALIDEFNCVHPLYFEQTLDFMLALGRRHREIEFSLVCLHLQNIRELMLKLSRVHVSQLIDAFVLRLRELVRSTDMVLRGEEGRCWLLLPQTPRGGLNVLLDRIRKFVESSATSPETALQLSIEAIASSELGDRRIEARLLMAELAGRDR
jgi:GGDEF domain-containing protein